MLPAAPQSRVHVLPTARRPPFSRAPTYSGRARGANHPGADYSGANQFGAYHPGAYHPCANKSCANHCCANHPFANHPDLLGVRQQREFYSGFDIPADLID